MSESATRYSAGDEVATPDGRGVVAAVPINDVEFPQGGGEDDYAAVEAGDDPPAYVVGLEAVGSAVYRASSLEQSDLEADDATESTDGDAVTDVVDEDVNGLDYLPEGWDRDSVLEYWSSIGGSWEECAQDLTDKFDAERAKQLCSAMKDEVLRTQRWRIDSSALRLLSTPSRSLVVFLPPLVVALSSRLEPSTDGLDHSVHAVPERVL
ncbi:hypothetical protein [Haloterrigena salifodinae]|uniref:hypothetical protein n=1 Tax=Haloterrigena salifodinae TaxID=2675099 RepID=UPI002011CC24|nr:hypothetical protein [Haloterrigena salifodinae]